MRPAINWKRGFLRLWVAVALIWAAGTVAVCWNSVATPYVAPHAFIDGKGDVAWSYASSNALQAREDKNSGRLREVAVDGAPGITFFTDKDTDQLNIAMERMAPIILGFYGAQQSQARTEAMSSALLGAIAPPLALLFVGIATGWIISGFARESRHPTAT